MFWLLINQYQELLNGLEKQQKSIDDRKNFQKNLLWFDGQMAKRQVLLFIDDFSTHHAGLNWFHEEYLQGLSNTKIVFLPLNATSVCQPLDQGIIKTWKVYCWKLKRYGRCGFFMLSLLSPFHIYI